MKSKRGGHALNFVVLLQLSFYYFSNYFLFSGGLIQSIINSFYHHSLYHYVSIDEQNFGGSMGATSSGSKSLINSEIIINMKNFHRSFENRIQRIFYSDIFFPRSLNLFQEVSFDILRLLNELITNGSCFCFSRNSFLSIFFLSFEYYICVTTGMIHPVVCILRYEFYFTIEQIFSFEIFKN